jgi:hypothetical protein
MTTQKIIVKVPKPFTRVAIKPIERHKDKKKDYERTPKHKDKHKGQ